MTPTPHREHRRDREHGGRRSRQVPDGTTPNQLVLSPTPAHVKSNRRPQTGERANTPRDFGSIQPFSSAPNRRPSQQQQQQHRDPHPYATVPNGHRTVTTPNTFGRHSPNPNESESFFNGQPPTGRNGSAPQGTTMRHPDGQAIGIREQMQRVREQDDGDHGRKGFRRFWCCG